MARRRKMSRRRSKRSFTYHAGIHPKNKVARPQRGGVRL